MTSLTSVQALSLSHYHNAQTRDDFVRALINSLKTFGFVVIKDHGLDASLLSTSHNLNQQLFALPTDKKLNYTHTQLGLRGYTAFAKEHAKDNPEPDLKEFWHIGPEMDNHSPYYGQYPSNLWPQEIADFEPAMLQLYRQLSDTGGVLLDAVGHGLGLPSDYFPQLIKDGNSVLRLIHYPPVRGMNTQDQMRAAPHADINLMTLLVGASDSGLQLLDRNNQWLAVDSQAGEIIVDSGDMMALITGNTLPSTVHRVINPVSESKPRYSMPFFVHPHANAELTCLSQFRSDEKRNYTSISAGEFLQQRLKENGLAS
ncbi:MAG: isopenicillin N synthase-like dioxygenase [Cryomorphaceae bacterium]|jgi:isopenicillin N synthase-like dioxygenase